MWEIHISKDVWEIHISEPRQQGCMEDHIDKDTWHNQMMISVKRKLTHDMSISDVRKLHHSERIYSGFLPWMNVKSPEAILLEWCNFLTSLIDMAWANFVLTLVITWLCHAYLLTWSTDMVCRCGLLTWYATMPFCWHGLLTNNLDPTILVCPPNPTILIHFRFLGFGYFISQTLWSVTSLWLYTRTKCCSLIRILDRRLDLSALRLC